MLNVKKKKIEFFLKINIKENRNNKGDIYGWAMCVRVHKKKHKCLPSIKTLDNELEQTNKIMYVEEAKELKQ